VWRVDGSAYGGAHASRFGEFAQWIDLCGRAGRTTGRLVALRPGISSPVRVRLRRAMTLSRVNGVRIESYLSGADGRCSSLVGSK